MAGNPLIERVRRAGIETVRGTRSAPVPRDMTPAERELEEERVRLREEEQREEIEEIREDIRARRELRRMRRDLEREKLQRQLRGEPEPTAVVQANGHGSDATVTALLDRMSSERNQLQGRLDALTDRVLQQQQTSATDALKNDIAQLRNEIARLGQAGAAATPQDPFSHWTQVIDQVLGLRRKVDELAPAPALPAQVDEVQKLQLEIQKMDRDIALEAVKERREAIQAEKDKAIGRMQELMDGVRDVAGPALAVLAQQGKLDPSILGRFIGMGGGGGDSSADVAESGNGTQPTTSSAATVRYRCPGCKREQSVPVAQADNWRCAFPDCRYGPVRVRS